MAAEEYMRRLSRYCSISLTIVKKEREWFKYLEKEKARVLVLPGSSQMTSEAFSGWLGECEMRGGGRLAFFIPHSLESEKRGGSGGTISNRTGDHPQQLPNELAYSYPDSDKGNEEISLSSFTMEPGMTGLVLLEQIYRGYRILHHHPYHK